MTESNKIHCGSHGWQERTFVCRHIVESLHTGIPVGFHWPSEQSDPRPDAWCSACEKARLEAGGDWTPEVVKKLGVQLLCGACYDYAKSLGLKGLKVSH